MGSVSVETEVAARIGSTRIPVDAIQVGTEPASEVNLSAAATGHDRCPLIDGISALAGNRRRHPIDAGFVGHTHCVHEALKPTPAT